MYSNNVLIMILYTDSVQDIAHVLIMVYCKDFPKDASQNLCILVTNEIPPS